ncbi:MAG: HAD hydrolase family protein [Candidatus Gastranaerophilales bacterium]|nr:HAD hydrolase family protein [Candidatus Gastranaerophilales bacterium]
MHIPKTVKMIISDFDGVMTDGCIYVDEDLKISRKVCFKDIMGVSILRKAGIELAFISGEKNPIIDLLAERFKIKETHQNIRIKLEVLKSIIEKYNLKSEEFLYIGDDINDIECLQFASVRITVPGAANAVKKVENIQITEQKGGDGAFREVVDCLLST